MKVFSFPPPTQTTIKKTVSLDYEEVSVVLRAFGWEEIGGLWEHSEAGRVSIEEAFESVAIEFLISDPLHRSYV